MDKLTSAKIHFKIFSQIIEGSIAEANEQASHEDGKVLNLNGEELANNSDIKIKERKTNFLKKARAALSRIKNGSYGICKECDGVIDESRLLARPTAELCIYCKEAEEKEEKLSKNKYTDSKTIVNNNILFLKDQNGSEVNFEKEVESQEKYLA
ncbi:MAG: TraR/DksA C4-type zinc finger protein [Bacteriovoracaceae bacterium]